MQKHPNFCAEGIQGEQGSRAVKLLISSAWSVEQRRCGVFLVGKATFHPYPKFKNPQTISKQTHLFHTHITLRCCALRESNGYFGFSQTFPHLPGRNHSVDLTKIQRRFCSQQNFPWASSPRRDRPPALRRRHGLDASVRARTRATPPQASASRSAGRVFSRSFQSPAAPRAKLTIAPPALPTRPRTGKAALVRSAPRDRGGQLARANMAERDVASLFC